MLFPFGTCHLGLAIGLAEVQVRKECYLERDRFSGRRPAVLGLVPRLRLPSRNLRRLRGETTCGPLGMSCQLPDRPLKMLLKTPTSEPADGRLQRKHSAEPRREQQANKRRRPSYAVAIPPHPEGPGGLEKKKTGRP